MYSPETSLKSGPTGTAANGVRADFGLLYFTYKTLVSGNVFARFHEDIVDTHPFTGIFCRVH
jgi:hypothetical protein